MTEYDVVVLGSGSGSHIVTRALKEGMSVGWIDEGPLGGTCMNVGCIPSKMLIHVADRVMEIREAGRLGVMADISAIDFVSVMIAMREVVARRQNTLLEAIKSWDNLTFYRERARFTGERTLKVGEEEEIRGGKVFVATGARPLVPPIEGMEDIDYITNESVLDLESPPRSTVVIGGGYIGTEYAHFLSAMGAEVTLLQREPSLVPAEDEQVSELLESRLKERMDVRTSTTVTGVRQSGNGYVVAAEGEGDGELEFFAESVFLAAGRRSNADRLDAESGGIELDDAGYIAVNGKLETSADRVWAFGDAIGKAMFTHAANRESVIAWHNSTSEDQVEMDYAGVPHAVFSWPQVAAVGITEREARESGRDYLVGVASYSDVAKGEATRERDAFAKAIVDAESRRILGFHIVGPEAPVLIQEVVNAVTAGQDVGDVTSSMHIHPALSELVTAALHRVAKPSRGEGEEGGAY